MLQHSSQNRIPLLTDAHEGSVRKGFQTDSRDSTIQYYVIRNSSVTKNASKKGKIVLTKIKQIGVQAYLLVSLAINYRTRLSANQVHNT
jgi:exosome complex RNA-binding protein Csl4